MQPDREIAEAWQRLSLADDEQIQANLRDFAEAAGESVGELADGLDRWLREYGGGGHAA